MKAEDYEKISLITAIKLITPISPLLESTIMDLVTIKKISRDRNLTLREDDHFFVAEGILKKENQHNHDVVHFIVEGQFGIFPPECSTYNFIGVENCSIAFIRQEDVDYLLTQNQRLLSAYRRFLFEWAMQRIWRAELLQIPAAEAKAVLLSRLGNLTNRIPNKDLAAYLSLNSSYYSSI